MGIVMSEETEKAEFEEFRRMLLSCAALNRRKEHDDGFGVQSNALPDGNGDVLDRLVCVTSGVSYLGIAIVNQLLVSGYSVRIIVDKEEDVEKLREMQNSGEMRLNNSIIEVFMAELTQVESLIEAFDGCRGVFHTAAFVDPAGLTGKAMADIEMNATKNVMKACGTSLSVRHCVLTSSLLTCIWQDHSHGERSRRIDHESWSDESVCINKKLWYALGKLRSEKAAWDIARESGLKLATICPALITGSEFYQRSPTSTLAYLKGFQEMYTHGLLATVNIDKLARAHVAVFEGMKRKTASGRYICFDRVIVGEEELEKLVAETGVSTSTSLIIGGVSCSNRQRFELSNVKLDRVMLRTRSCRRE
ncbi:hypothetical protein OROGR_007640 [Orobanche gracilis]